MSNKESSDDDENGVDALEKAVVSDTSEQDPRENTSEKSDSTEKE